MQIITKDEIGRKVDTVAIVCARCDVENRPVSGTVEGKCNFCGAKVWISPSSMKRKFDVIYCEDCFQLDYNKKEHKVSVSNETIDEFNKWQKDFGYNEKVEDVIKIIEETKGIKITKEESESKE